MMDVCLPGTGGMIPLANRWLTCCWLEYMGEALLIDCGEGTQIALKAAGCKISRLNMLLITHYHADHIAGLPGLLLTLGNCHKVTPLTIIGPSGLTQVVSALTVITPVLPYPLKLLEWHDDVPMTMDFGLVCVSSLPLLHSMPCLGYRIDLKRKPVFNPEKAKALGIPQRDYHTLHDGQPVLLANGRLITPPMVIDDTRPPICVCYITDTKPVNGLADFAREADLLISEGMHADEALRAKMAEKGHMLFSDSAELARDAHVKRLWLTHYSPAMANPEVYLENARSLYPDAVAARDGMRISLGPDDGFSGKRKSCPGIINEKTQLQH